jgi:hypothetical protein
MTDTLVAAIITTSGVLLVGVISHWRKTHQPSQQEPKPVIIQPTISAQVRQPVVSAATDRATDLSHARISGVIEAVPPLQRDGIRDSFIGVSVTWRGKLFTASRKGDMVYVSLRNISPGGIILCTAAYCDCVALLIATEGTEFIVTGKIKNVESMEAIFMTVNLRYHKKQPNKSPESTPISRRSSASRFAVSDWAWFSFIR